MTEVARFRDCTSLLNAASALRRQLSEEGYVLLRGYLEAGDVEAVRSDFAAALAARGWLAEESSCVIAPDVRPMAQGVEEWNAGYGAVQALESFHRLAHHPRLASLIELLYGSETPTWCHPSHVARLALPDPRGRIVTPPHQDFAAFEVTTDVIGTWIPLMDIPESMGGLRILRGAQKRGFVTPPPGRTGRMAWLLTDEEVSPDDPAWATADYEQGDVLVLHALSLHAARPNRTDRLRLSIDFRYQALADPCYDGVLNPHLYPAITPGWDVLTKGWKSTRWIEAPSGANLVPRTKMPEETMGTLQATHSRFIDLAA